MTNELQLWGAAINSFSVDFYSKDAPLERAFRGRKKNYKTSTNFD